MHLRRLATKDIPLMLEWMHDPEIMACFQFDASGASEATCKAFIETSFTEDQRHYAIADESDEYLGTISLKQIDQKNGTAEYAIVLRRSSMGKGLAHRATDDILDIAYNELGLRKVYLNVLSDNVNARRLYEKCGFVLEGIATAHIVKDGCPKDLCWYAHFDPRVGAEDRC